MLSQRGVIRPIYFWLRQGDKSTLLRWMLLFGVLVGATALPWMERERESLLLMGGIIGIGALWFLLRWPQLGIFGAILGGMFIPFHGPSGLNMTMIILALTLGLWLLSMLHQKKIAIVPSSTTLPLLVMIVLGSISFGFGQLPWFAFANSAPLGAQVASLTVLILSAGAFLFVGNQIRDLRWLQALVWIFLGVGAFYILGRAIPQVGSLTGRLFVRGLEGSLFWIWIIVLAFSQAIFNPHLRSHWRVALLGLVMAAFYVVFVQTYDWKSGWVPAVIGIGAIFIAYSWRLGLIFSPFVAIAAVYLSERLIESDAYSYSTRVDAWILMGQVILESPVLGLGWANYRWFMPLFPIRGYTVYFNSHNQYIDIMAQTGILGLLCFLWFFTVVGLVGWKLRTQVPEGFPRAYVYGALGGLAATLAAGMLGDWILPYFYNIGLTGFRSSILAWIFLGGLVMLAQIYNTNSESRNSS